VRIVKVALDFWSFLEKMFKIDTKSFNFICIFAHVLAAYLPPAVVNWVVSRLPQIVCVSSIRRNPSQLETSRTPTPRHSGNQS
jgi:hypothetical protein